MKDDEKVTKTKTEPEETMAVKIKYYLSIWGAIAVLLFFGFLLMSDSVMNFQCSFWESITFQCNRFDGEFKKWE